MFGNTLALPLWQFAAIALILLIVWLLLWRILRYTVIRDARSDAIGRSKSVILGEVYEKIAPMMRGFPYKARDMIFVWKWVDYVVFDGLAEWELREIIFLELKTGRSSQNSNERQIARVVSDWKVRYELLKLDARMGNS